MHKYTMSRLGFIIYIIGILLGLFLVCATTWAGLEADFYFGYSIPSDESLNSLKCPILITPKDTGKITITLQNPTLKSFEQSVNMEISNPGLFRTDRTAPLLPAGEEKELTWKISADDVVFGHLIIARAYVFQAYTLPSQKGTCGILWSNTRGLSGIAILCIIIAISILCVVIGIWLWLHNRQEVNKEKTNRPDLLSNVKNSIFILITFVVLGLIVSFVGWWVAGLVCIIFSLLILSSMVMQWAQT